jgi:hypothetical protein
MSIHLKDKIAISISVVALIVSFLGYWDSHAMAGLEQAKVNLDIHTLRASLNRSDGKIGSDGIVIVYKNISDIPIEVRTVEARFAPIAPKSAAEQDCFRDLTKLTIRPDSDSKAISKNRLGDAEVIFTMPASCQNVNTNILLVITYSGTDSLSKPRFRIEDGFYVDLGKGI